MYYNDSHIVMTVFSPKTMRDVDRNVAPWHVHVAQRRVHVVGAKHLQQWIELEPIHMMDLLERSHTDQ
jgi:hypothetical protein